METKKISDALSVGPQLYLTDLAEVAKAGFKSILVNRPDGEGDDQPTFAEVEADARGYGLEARYVPVVPGKVADADVEAFAAAVEELPKPIFGFCRTGTRTTTLWALSQAGSRPLTEILGTAKAAGYDLSGVALALPMGDRSRPMPQPKSTRSSWLVVVPPAWPLPRAYWQGPAIWTSSLSILPTCITISPAGHLWERAFLRRSRPASGSPTMFRMVPN